MAVHKIPIIDSSSTTATPPDLLEGKTAISQRGQIVGTIPNKGTVNHSLPINGSYTIPKGYHNGNGIISQSISTK